MKTWPQNVGNRISEDLIFKIFPPDPTIDLFETLLSKLSDSHGGTVLITQSLPINSKRFYNARRKKTFKAKEMKSRIR